MRSLHLISRLVAYRWRAACALALLAAGFAAAYSVAAAGIFTLRSEQIEGVTSDVASFPFVAQAGSSAGTQLLQRDRTLIPVADETGEVLFDKHSLGADVRSFSSTSSRPGVLIAGTTPRTPGQAVISEVVGSTLSAHIGSSIQIRLEGEADALRVTVSGVVVDPGDRSRASVAVLRSRNNITPTEWLSSTDLYSTPSLTAALDNREISYRTTKLLAEETFAASPTAQTYRTISMALIGLPVLSAAIAGILLSAFARVLSPSVTALAAAGMARSRSWRLLVTAASLVLVVGGMAGLLFGVTILELFKVEVAGTLNQYWTSLSAPWARFILYCALVPGASVGLATLSFIRLPLADRRPPSRLSRPTWAATCFLGAALLWGLIYIRILTVGWGLLATSAVALGAVSAGYRLATTKLDPAVKRLFSFASRGLVGLSLSAILVSAVVGLYSAGQQENSDIAYRTSFAGQPYGSLLVLGVNSSSEARIADAFRRLGGLDSTWYESPVETKTTLRVTSPRMANCARAHPTIDSTVLINTCGPRGTQVPVNVVVLTNNEAPAGSATVVADPALISDGKVGLIDYSAVNGRVLGTAIVRASPGTRLGGNLPGAVIRSDSALARAYDLKPSGTGLLAMFGLPSLNGREESAVRFAVVHFAPTAQIAAAYGIDDGGARGRSVASAIVGAALILLLCVGGVWAFLSSQIRLRRTFRELGVTARTRLEFSTRLFLIPVVGVIAATGGTLVTSWFFGAHTLASSWLWTAPALVATLTFAAGAVVYAYTLPPSGLD